MEEKRRRERRNERSSDTRMGEWKFDKSTKTRERSIAILDESKTS